MNERKVKRLITKTEKESANINKEVNKLVDEILVNLQHTQKATTKNIDNIKKELDGRESARASIGRHLNEAYEKGEDISWDTRKKISRLKKDANKRKKKLNKHLKSNLKHLKKTGHNTKEGLHSVINNHVSPLSIEFKDSVVDKARATREHVVDFKDSAIDLKDHVVEGYNDKVLPKVTHAKDNTSEIIKDNIIPLASKVSSLVIDRLAHHKDEFEDEVDIDEIYLDDSNDEETITIKKSSLLKNLIIGLSLAPLGVAGALAAKARIIDKRSVSSYALELGYKGLDYKNKTGFLENDYEMNALLLENAKVYSSTPYELPLKFRNKYELFDTDYKDVYRADNIGGVINRIVVFFHSGLFWLQPDDAQYKYACALADDLEAEVFIPIYPLAPTYNYKDMYAFLEDFYKKLVEDHKDSEIVFVGNSNGATLALGLGMLAVEKGLKVPDTIVLNSPILNAKLDNPYVEELAKVDPIHRLYDAKLRLQYFANHEDEDNYLISPILGKLEGLKEIVVNTGSKDIFYADALDFLDKCAVDDKVINYFEYKNLIHNFMQHSIPEANEVMVNLRGILGIEDYEYVIEEDVVE